MRKYGKTLIFRYLTHGAALFRASHGRSLALQPIGGYAREIADDSFDKRPFTENFKVSSERLRYRAMNLDFDFTREKKNIKVSLDYSF